MSEGERMLTEAGLRSLSDRIAGGVRILQRSVGLVCAVCIFTAFFWLPVEMFVDSARVAFIGLVAALDLYCAAIGFLTRRHYERIRRALRLPTFWQHWRRGGRLEMHWFDPRRWTRPHDPAIAAPKHVLALALGTAITFTLLAASISQTLTEPPAGISWAPFGYCVGCLIVLFGLSFIWQLASDREAQR